VRRRRQIRAREDADAQERLATERRIKVRALFDRWAGTELQPRVLADGTRLGRKDAGASTKARFERGVLARSLSGFPNGRRAALGQAAVGAGAAGLRRQHRGGGGPGPCQSALRWWGHSSPRASAAREAVQDCSRLGRTGRPKNLAPSCRCQWQPGWRCAAFQLDVDAERGPGESSVPVESGQSDRKCRSCRLRPKAGRVATNGTSLAGGPNCAPLDHSWTPWLVLPTRTPRSSHADRLLKAVSAIVLFGMMVMTFADVVGRKFFGTPVRGAFELTELAMVVLIYTGLPLVSRAEEHVTMDFADRIWPNARRALQATVDLLLAALLAGLAWLVFVKAGRITTTGDRTAVLALGLGPVAYFIAALIGLTAAIHLGKAWTGSARR
jgi:TRAP-type C4-dicarboxylate transport system permease small subunit